MTRAWWQPAALVTAFLVLYGFRLGEPSWDGPPPRYVFDEIYTAFTAHRIERGDDKAFEPGVRRYRYLADDPRDLALMSRGEWSHPPGAPLLMACLTRVMGFRAVAVRLASLLAALATLLATAAFTGRRWQLACGLLALDGVFFVFARTAMPHMLVVGATTLGALLLHRATLCRPRRPWLTIAAGACFGLAASARWTAIPIALAMVVAVVLSKGRRGSVTLGVALCAVLAAVATYVSTYAPFFLHGHGVSSLFALHEKMLWFNRHIGAPSGQVTPWYAWPVHIDAVLFNARPNAMVLCTGGRALWWALIPVLVLAVRRWAQGRSARDGLALGAILGSWLPWALLSRWGFSYYLLPALPFCAFLVTRELSKLARRWRWAPAGYLAFAVVNFVVLYPVLAAVPLSESQLATYRALLSPAAAREATSDPASVAAE